MAAGARLAVFDLDGTLTRHDTLAPFVFGYLARHPWRIARLPLVLPASVRFLFDRDRGALKGSFIHATLAGVSRAGLQPWIAQFVRRVLARGLYPQAQQALERHRLAGDRLLLMSAAPDLYLPQLAAALGFDEFICTQVRWRADGRLDGRLASPNCRDEEKRRQLAALIARQSPSSVCAYGNAASDLPHMQLAQESYLINCAARVRSPPGVQRLRWR